MQKIDTRLFILLTVAALIGLFQFTMDPKQKHVSKEDILASVGHCSVELAKTLLFEQNKVNPAEIFKTDLFWQPESKTPQVLVRWFANENSLTADSYFVFDDELRIAFVNEKESTAFEVPYLELDLKSTKNSVVLWEPVESDLDKKVWHQDYSQCLRSIVAKPTKKPILTHYSKTQHM